MNDHKQYLVLHDYGSPENIVVVGETDSMLEACRLRENDLSNGGGECLIVEYIRVFDAYRRAGYEYDQERQREGLAK